MRLPEPPPPYQSLLMVALGHAQRWKDLFSQENLSATQHGQYLHWDDVLARPEPSDMTREEWWLIAKTARQATRQSVPLKDKKGAPFSFSLVPEMFEALHHIDQRCAGNIVQDVLHFSKEELLFSSAHDRRRVRSS